MKGWGGLLLLILVAGCGVETAGTAAVQADLKAREAEQARQVQQEVQRQLDAAQQLHEQTLKAADQASQ